MTQKEVLENVLNELMTIKKGMPNGELKVMIDGMKEMKEDVSELKYMLLNPTDGIVVKTNQNTEFRKRAEDNDKENRSLIMDLEDLKRWKDGVNKALWILFAAIVGIVIKMLMMING
tara:strand:- start:1680 stop:2030 length:351 start_codon:yes stop_codon:yes gene_type:complete